MPVPASVSTYRQASAAKDVAAMTAACAEDIRFPSPLFRRLIFTGRADVTSLLAIVYSTLREVEWNEPVGDGHTWIVFGQAHIGRMSIRDAMVMTIDDRGQISEIVPHLGPWSATTAFLALLAPRLVIANPGIVLRAFRAGRA